MTCSACPFAFTDRSEYVQNLGCLPSPYEIMAAKRDTGRNWACHDDERRVCAGFVQKCRERGIDYRGADLVTLTEWNATGFGPSPAQGQSQSQGGER